MTGRPIDHDEASTSGASQPAPPTNRPHGGRSEDNNASTSPPNIADVEGGLISRSSSAYSVGGAGHLDRGPAAGSSGDGHRGNGVAEDGSGAGDANTATRRVHYRPSPSDSVDVSKHDSEAGQVIRGVTEDSANEYVLRSHWGDARDKLAGSLPEAHASVSYPPASASFWRQLAAFSGIGLMVSVGYIDPGNWATDIAGGADYGYKLLCVILGSNLLAMFLQFLSLKLGIASEMDLAQACRVAYPVYVTRVLWVIMEIAIMATDLAEVLGSAIAIHLLSGIPIWAGVLITAADVLIIVMVGLRSFRLLEAFIALLMALIVVSFVYQLAVVKPYWPDVFDGLLPKQSLFTNGDMLYNAIGILGATVMPHNLFLHSSTIQTRKYPRTVAGKFTAVRFGTIDSTVSLSLAFFINAAILILAAAAFHFGDNPQKVGDITEAYQLLAPAVGAKAAPILFAVALLAAGQQSTITGTFAGQIVMEGFIEIRLKPWLRRLVTRSTAIVPAVVVAAIMGGPGVNKLLILSQVILSLSLTFAVVPLVHFTAQRKVMGDQVNHWFTTSVGAILAVGLGVLNIYSLSLQLSTGSVWGGGH